MEGSLSPPKYVQQRLAEDRRAMLVKFGMWVVEEVTGKPCNREDMGSMVDEYKSMVAEYVGE